MDKKTKLINFKAPVSLVEAFDKVISKLKVNRTVIFQELMKKMAEEFKAEIKTKSA